MGNSIATGPFRVPELIVGTTEAPTRLIINLKNPTDNIKNVRVEVHQCPRPSVPTIPPGPNCTVTSETVETVICNQAISLKTAAYSPAYSSNLSHHFFNDHSHRINLFASFLLTICYYR